MPFYDYQCSKCGAIKEDVMHSVAEIEEPSEETKQEITCNCTKKGTLMKVAFLTAPAIKTPTRNRYLNEDRKKRNKKHFVKNDLPTIQDKDAKRHHVKKLGYKN